MFFGRPFLNPPNTGARKKDAQIEVTKQTECPPFPELSMEQLETGPPGDVPSIVSKLWKGDG